jgi:hypothetical protein
VGLRRSCGWTARSFVLEFALELHLCEVCLVDSPLLKGWPHHCGVLQMHGTAQAVGDRFASEGKG